MDLATLTMADVLTRLRREYLALERAGTTHDQMADATGLPRSTFSMWLRGYRPVVKVEVVEGLLAGYRSLSDDPLA